jgi:putative thiamine transport system substrate-binding protein
VYFNAWGGTNRINAYIQWAGPAGATAPMVCGLEHVKISDAADVVKRVRGEKAAGKAGRHAWIWCGSTAKLPGHET